MRPHKSTHLLDADAPSVVTPVGSPERAGKDAGSNAVERGASGVFLTDYQVIKIARLDIGLSKKDVRQTSIERLLHLMRKHLAVEKRWYASDNWKFCKPRSDALSDWIKVLESMRDDRQDDDQTFGLASSA